MSKDMDRAVLSAVASVIRIAFWSVIAAVAVLTVTALALSSEEAMALSLAIGGGGVTFVLLMSAVLAIARR